MATSEEQTGKSIDTAFKKFHKDNPKVYQMFKEQVYRAIRNGREKFSANAIINWIRWEVALKVKTDEEYKINNNFSSRYARLFVKDHPEHEHMFNFRDLRSGQSGGPKKPIEIDDHLISILELLGRGASIYYHADNDTVGMVLKNGNKHDITMPQFNKLRSKRLIMVAGQQSILATQYQISDKGRKHIPEPDKKAA